MSAVGWLPIPFEVDQNFIWKIGLYVTLLISLTFHEYGHGWSAKKLGDDTAERMGRLSLNPLVHIDLFFTVLLPLYFLFGTGGSGSLGLCAAKPVPVNPYNLRKPTRDMMLTSAAGPAMNVLLAFAFTGFYWIHTQVRGIPWDKTSSLMIENAIALNLQLAIFNMLPIPPLDGHRVLGYFLPPNLRDAYYRIGVFGGLAVILLLMLTGGLSWIFMHVTYPTYVWWGETFKPDHIGLLGAGY
jgi:Zn-dependent protease